MSEIERTTLFGKLSPSALRALHGAAEFCKTRGNAFVEIEHWLHQMLQLPDSDLQRILERSPVDRGKLARDLTHALDRLRRGATSISDFSLQVWDSVERGWIYATLLFHDSQVRTGYLLVGWLKTKELRSVLGAISPELLKIELTGLVERFSELTAGSPEARSPSEVGASSAASGGAPSVLAAARGGQEALARFTIDLTERARQRELDPIVGRDDEIRQIAHILVRRRQNNPILTGEAGVGKTAVVEGFAQRVAKGDVPPQLEGVSVLGLDIGLLQAGASMKGEFEARLRQVMDEVQASPKPIILFIDEAHTLIGAGGAQGTGDAANLLKPALARGKLRTIAATTWAEYKRYIESDPALARRFQVVPVKEPSEERALLMLRGNSAVLESHHRVHVLGEALHAAVKLSKRYIVDRQLPDKAVSLLDTACGRVAMSQHGTPPEVEASRERIQALKLEIEIIERERAIGISTGSRGDERAAELRQETECLGRLEQRWRSEKALVERVLAIQTELRPQPQQASAKGKDSDSSTEPNRPAPNREQLLAELTPLQAELSLLQAEKPLVLPTVNEQAVATVVADWTGIPVARMVKNELESVLNLAEQLGRRVVGQDHGLEMITRRILTARAGLENPNKPIGVFLLAGPSGVGKTETALTLAEALYGGEQNVITINMSEFQEAHTVATLKGAPPGYVGYGKGGVLTEAVRRRPYSVVLLDEVEKAHPDVHEIFFQVFDKGWMDDAQGTRIDFKNTVILLTSNIGSELILSLCEGSSRPDPARIGEALRRPLLEVFPAALLGRIVVIPYYPLSDAMLGNIVRLQLDRVGRRVTENYSAPFTYDASVVELITARCTEVESGGRMIDAVLTNTLLPQLSRELLERRLGGTRIQRVAVTAHAGEFQYAFS